ncbi:MAG: bifunctional phosphoribosyl-AMP cyclohydrolase/phosphoribosyl-ATP diphosphatase HisIE [Nitrolancea sp.]
MSEELLSRINFDEHGLVPAIVQDAVSGDVRMLGYMNRESLGLTLQTGNVHFWSRSRAKLWMKGESSGNVLHVVDLRMDCDGDTLLVRVRADGPTCHLGTETCFDDGLLATLEEPAASSRVVDEVAAVVADRRQNPVDGSYTSYLLAEGVDKIGKKIGEEAAEVIIAAKNEDSATIAAESSDLIYHLLVMLEATGVDVEKVWDVLATRRGRPAPDQVSQ